MEAPKLKEELENTLYNQNINVDIKHVGCVGICNQVPLMEIHKPGETPSFYAKIQPEEVKGIIQNHFKSATPVGRLKNSFYNFFENLVLENTPITLKRYEADKRDTPVSEFLGWPN